jgi:arylsulfatase
MKTKNLLFIFVLLIFTISCQNKKETKLPNVVVIFIDDMGYADLSCFGATEFETPNLDKMADEGIRFTSFYSSTGVCSASRASLMTGCYCDRVSIHGAFMPDSKQGLNPNETTIAEMLKPLGYKTAIFGKWHLGHHKEFMPLQQGFDEYFGIPYSNDMWPVDYDGVAVKDKKNPTKPQKRRFPPLPLIEGNEKIKEIWTLEEQGELTTLYTEKAVDFINRNKENPFFLYVPHSMVHVPIAVSDKFKGKSKQGLFGDVVMEVDWSVGEIVKALKDNGIAENTLVIFTSDNGPWLNFGNHAGLCTPLREGKGTVWEGGHREPCIMWWPGKIEPKQTIDKIVSTIDVLPTIAEITGATLPEKKIDGISFLPILNSEDVTTRDEFWCYYGGGLRAIRKGDWKLYFPQTYRSYIGVEPGEDGFPGPYAKGVLDKIVLYNLKNDISETTDVSAENPEIVEQLIKIGEQARKELGDRLTKVKGEEVREPGKIL